MLHRTSEAFACWFKSGSRPYAQVHCPFEDKREQEGAFPTDFVAEGAEHTRGLHSGVLATALFGQLPFRNMTVHGLILASDGQKRSKRNKNYLDLLSIIHGYGADALRFYLINSPVVRENLCLKDEGVRDVLKDVWLPWYNAFCFFIRNVLKLQKKEMEFLYENTV